ncbi:MAG: hypothetical protein IKC09_02305 [Oscillospiraceae bacterium]|nr:hypothetical protein [Oscillospiraceae bacterium]
MIQKSKETLVREFEEAKTALEAGPEPRAERKKLLRTLLRNTGIVLLVLALIATSVFFAMMRNERFRVPFLNKLIYHYPIIIQWYHLLDVPQAYVTKRPPTADFFAELVPDGFELLSEDVNHLKYWIFTYRNPDTRATLVITGQPEDFEGYINTVGAITRQVDIIGYTGYLIKQKTIHGDPCWMLIWHIPAAEKYYTIETYKIEDEELLLNLARHMAIKIRETEFF